MPALPTPDASPVARLDWPALRAAVAGCRACSLCESRHQTVFGIGHPRAHCMVVGEAPGEQEEVGVFMVNSLTLDGQDVLSVREHDFVVAQELQFGERVRPRDLVDHVQGMIVRLQPV